MKRTYSARALYTLLLMVSFQIFGGGNFAQAQTETAITSFSGNEVGTTEQTDAWYRNSSATWNSSYYKVLSGAAIYSPQMDWSVYTKITITVNARTFGGVTATNNKISVKIGATEIGTITPTSSGLSDYTITAENPTGTDRLCFSCDGATSSKGSGIAAITITGIEGTQKTDPELAFPQGAYSAEKNEGFSKPELQNKYNVKVSYNSSNPNVATVNEETGDVTLVGKGTTIISATSESDETYKGSSASYTLEVTDKFALVTLYRKIMSESELTDGGIYLLAGSNSGDEIYMMSALNSNGNNRVQAIATVTDGNIILNDVNTTDTPYEITLLDNGNGQFNLKVKGTESDVYLLNGRTKASGSNYLKESTSLTDDGTAWNCIVDTETGSVKFSNTINNIESAIFYNESNSIFSCYAATNNNTNTSRPVYLYRKVVEFAADEAVENYATFCANYAYEMPAGMTGYAVTATSDGKLTMTEAYTAGKAVPANTPLLLKGETTDTYYPVILNRTVDAYTGENHLEAGRTANGYTQSSREGVYYYKLTVNENGKTGFYWGAADGAAFKMMKTSTAYLAVDKAQGVRGFIFESGEATNIGEVVTNAQNESNDAPIYTLSGIRVRTAKSELPAGIYIMNGKKLMVK